MREPYLLAAGLLTGLALPASALPQMSMILPEESEVQWDAKQGSQTVTDVKNISSTDISLPEFSNQLFHHGEILPTVSENNDPRFFNLSLPEFSSQTLPPLEASQPKAGEKNLTNPEVTLPQFNEQELTTPIDSFLPLNSQPGNLPLVSGSQLYYQRLAALKTGQIYTRTETESAQSLPDSRKKQQLTYEDWKSLLAMEAKAIAQGQGKNRLSILVGDSLSMWFPRGKLPSGKLWLNQGISGDTTSGVANRLAAFSQTRPDAVYVMAGINDLRKGASDEVILRNHRRIIRSLRQHHPKAQIFLQSILPTDLSTIPNSRIRHLNVKLAEIAKQEKANYLDIYTWFTDADGKLRSDLTTDGLHLSADGYDVWRFALQQVEFKLNSQ
ncbi:SGNH/GDSL hydrolase family protein [Nostoc sp. TCL26-01]|uniref:SGNH/GDSL hydrolase family protein n=1 Tax=Nostoc sp. TCL26-01 TaxID=2576904 RepID=UPI0015C1B7EA|nr:SGNH/GDSL hydrolase family protein [Nostoc sp. TCL26-01]QLE54647.1 G-D-S-L family lipolytic protein [Nostoc sp. TCL26-01]